MRNLLIGCGVILLLVVLGIGYLGWRGYNAVRGFSEGVEEVQQAYGETNRKFAFTPPADGVPTAEQLERWLSVREQVAGELRQIQDRVEQETSPMSAMREAMNMVITAGHQHVAALEREAMSAEEYRWITSRVMSALDAPAARQDPELGTVAGDAEEELAALPEEEGPPLEMWGPPLSEEQLETLLPLLRERADRIERTNDVIILEIMLEESVRAESAASPAP